MPNSNRFEKILDKAVKANDNYKLQERQVRSYFLKVSADASGNDPTEFFSKADSKVCHEFIEFMKKRKWPGAENLLLERLKLRRPLTKEDMMIGSWAYGRFSRLIKLPHWHVVWVGRGYSIGVVSLSARDPYPGEDATVFLCDDGKLRVRRSPPLFVDGYSYAAGVGTIPKLKRFNEGFTIAVGEFISLDDRNKLFKRYSVEALLNKYLEVGIIEKFN